MESLELGFRHIARAVAKATEETDKVWFDENFHEGWDSLLDLHQLLKKRTSGDARQAVLGAARENGWEAWRRLTVQFETTSAIKQGQVLCELTLLGHKGLNPHRKL